jgi:hypothetical protein
VIAPLHHQLAIASKGDVARRERAQLAEAAATDAAASGQLTPAFLGIAADLRLTCDRLERQAAGAELDGQRLAVAALSQAQMRSAETRAKLSGVGGYAPPRTHRGAGKGEFFDRDPVHRWPVGGDHNVAYTSDHRWRESGPGGGIAGSLNPGRPQGALNPVKALHIAQRPNGSAHRNREADQEIA